MSFTSLCLLAYKRPDRLRECLQSIRDTADAPYEIIVNLDGGDTFNINFCVEQLKNGYISKLILSGGNNRGVGRSFQNCLGVAEGEYIFKIDTDLTFKIGWLSRALGIIKNNFDVGAVSLFDYHYNDPNDERFKPEYNHLEEREDCLIVKDFVSSIYGFRAEAKKLIEPVEDDGNHTKFPKLAITKENYVTNHGFGVGKSVYVSGTPEAPYKTPTHDEPLVYLKGLQT